MFSDPDELPTPEVTPFQRREHYAAIVALLRACDVKAHVYSNGLIMGVQVEQDTGEQIVWANMDNWAWTLVETNSDGEVRIGKSDLPAFAPVEMVARQIMEQDYS
jgi:hypothetical protein